MKPFKEKVLMDIRSACEQTDWASTEIFINNTLTLSMYRCPQCGYLVFDPAIYTWSCPRCQWCPTAGDGGEVWL